MTVVIVAVVIVTVVIVTVEIVTVVIVTGVIVTVVIVTVVIVKVVIMTVVIVTIVIVTYFRRKKIYALTTEEMFEGQRFSILAMFFSRISNNILGRFAYCRSCIVNSKLVSLQFSCQMSNYFFNHIGFNFQ